MYNHQKLLDVLQLEVAMQLEVADMSTPGVEPERTPRRLRARSADLPSRADKEHLLISHRRYPWTGGASSSNHHSSRRSAKDEATTSHDEAERARSKVVQTERPWNQMVRTAARFARARDANRTKCLGERRHVGETLQGMAPEP